MRAGPMKNEGIPSLRVPILEAILAGIETLTFIEVDRLRDGRSS